MSVTRVLVANRGEIAVRIIRACRSLGIETVAACSDADRESMAAQMANRTVCIGPARSIDSYLKVENLIAAAHGTGCDALHPGYGFLSERAALAQACADNQITFVGPSAENISQMGDKLEARKIARAAGVPLVPGSDQARNPHDARSLAAEIGYPLLLKAAAGGGGSRRARVLLATRRFVTLLASCQGPLRTLSLYYDERVRQFRVCQGSEVQPYNRSLTPPCL